MASRIREGRDEDGVEVLVVDDSAANDYEPTPEEIHQTFGMFGDEEPGAHGTMELIPTMERYIWMAEGVWWTNRQVLDSGHVRLSWLIPHKQAFRH